MSAAGASYLLFLFTGEDEGRFLKKVPPVSAGGHLLPSFLAPSCSRIQGGSKTDSMCLRSSWYGKRMIFFFHDENNVEGILIF